MDLETLLLILAGLVFLDLIFDGRIWNQVTLEGLARTAIAGQQETRDKIEEVRKEFNGKSDQLLKTTMILADLQGYNRAMDEKFQKEKK